MMFTFNRPPEIWSSVAICRASCGGQLSPTRTAMSNLIRLVSAAIALAKALGRGSKVVTILCDTGFRYLSSLYDDEWRVAKGLAPLRSETVAAA